ncbi:hypothetical protein [Sphingomonas sp. G-3-2-10]|uniref:hypothetical protein n=1 Tax=Sphingomonas sp. G-3-2-10 TaxID=2728838 RepID=UPI00146D0FE3|nr:hypothetical protein [Sphingomonas sp. G-3-2-10]NML04262.1 hypothetical protein [Sphingomonas sp. G-3-2-10]
MQTNFDSLVSARSAIISFAMNHASALDEAVRDSFLDLAGQPSPVDQVVKVAELLYANAASLTDEGRDLVGSLASYASENFWHGMQVDGRGNRIALAMRRQNGETPPEGSSFPDPETDPAPLPAYAPASPEA